MINLRQAWITLGRDPAQVFQVLSEAGDTEARVLAAEKAAGKAKKLAKKLMAKYHPDRNPKDPTCTEKFRLVVEALASIEEQTKALRDKYTRMKLREAEPPPGFITIKP